LDYKTGSKVVKTCFFGEHSSYPPTLFLLVALPSSWYYWSWCRLQQIYFLYSSCI